MQVRGEGGSSASHQREGDGGACHLEHVQATRLTQPSWAGRQGEGPGLIFLLSPPGEPRRVEPQVGAAPFGARDEGRREPGGFFVGNPVLVCWVEPTFES